MERRAREDEGQRMKERTEEQKEMKKQTGSPVPSFAGFSRLNDDGTTTKQGKRIHE